MMLRFVNARNDKKKLNEISHNHSVSIIRFYWHTYEIVFSLIVSRCLYSISLSRICQQFHKKIIPKVTLMTLTRV